MIPLTEGALDKIMNGIDVEKPVLQVLGHKKLSSSSSGERYRLLVSDGVRINSFTMLATQLNSMITDNLLTEFSICEIDRYAISMVNNGGKQKRVMVILKLDLKVPGVEVGHKIGNPTNADINTEGQAESRPTSSNVEQRQTNNSVQQNKYPSSAVNISTIPIVALSPYQNRWVIKARVTSKSDIRTWSNSRGEGKLFSMDLVDESGEIRCTAFRDMCDKFYNMIEVGNVYYISRCAIKSANKQYSTLKNDYEMTMNNDTEIIPCYEDNKEIPTLQFHFAPISEVENKVKNDMIDILAVVKTCGDLQVLTSRTTGKELKKRDVHLVDESNVMVCLTFWGTQAEEFNGTDNPVLAIKGARIAEFNNAKTLSTISSTVIQVDPDIPEAHRLRGWYNAGGCTENVKVLSNVPGSMGGFNTPWYTFRDVRLQQLGHKDTAEFYLIKATVIMIKVENALYKSCPAEGCKKKVIDQANEMYRCEKCNKEYPNFKYRLLASAHLADWTDHHWVTAFSEDAEKLLGITAQELGELRENDNDAYLQKFRDAAFKSYIFKLRVKLEVFNDEGRLRTTCVSIMPLDYKMYNSRLINSIKDIVGIEKLKS